MKKEIWWSLGRAALNEYLNKCLHNMDVHMYSRYRTRFAYKTCEKTGHVEEVESTQGDRHGAPGCICLCLYTSISSTLGSKSWHWHKPSSNQQSAHGLCITICTLTHRPHRISFPSTLSLAHSLVLSVWSCCVLLFILDLLVLLSSSSSLASSSSPSGPGIEKNPLNHQYHHPDSRSSNPPIHYPPPTTHRPPSHSHTSHLTPHTANHKPASSPQLRSLPQKSSPESPNPGPDPGALCALRTASPSLTTLEARDTRRAPAWAACYPRPVLELRS